MNTSTGRKALERRFIASGQPLPSGGPLAYCPLQYIGGGSQLFVFVTLENAIHIFVLRDNSYHRLWY